MRWIHAVDKPAPRARVGVMDDWQKVARTSADWSLLEARADVTVLDRPLLNEDQAAAALGGFDILIPMRERTVFDAALIHRLPRLRMIAQTGGRAQTMDLPAATASGILVCNTAGQRSGRGTAELTLGLMLAVARRIPEGDAAMRAGRFQDGVGIGPVMEGLTLGLIGLGRIGAMVAAYGQALGMTVLAWSPNLTDATAAAAGATRVERDELLARSDVVSLHVVLSERSRGILGAPELARMKRGAMLLNTSRGPLVDEDALIEALTAGRIRAGLDVFDQEPLPPKHRLRSTPNTVLTPHVGYGTTDTFRQFYRESIENVLAYLDGTPMRMVNPEAWRPPEPTEIEQPDTEPDGTSAA